MDVINNKMYKGIDALVSPFIKDEDGVIYNTANKAVKDFEVKVASISENSNEAFDELEQQSKKKIDELKELTEELQRTVIAEFDKELVALTDKSTVHFQSLKPSFTEQTFEDIRKETKSKAIEKEYFDDGVTFKDIKSRSVYSRNKHYGLVKGNIMSRIKTIKTDMIVNLLDFIEKVRKRYTSELSKNADIKKRELDAIFEAKITAEETKKIISDLALLTEDISTAKSGVERIRGGITKNV